MTATLGSLPNKLIQGESYHLASLLAPWVPVMIIKRGPAGRYFVGGVRRIAEVHAIYFHRPVAV